MASYASATYKNTSDLERGPATRSPLHKSMEFSAIDNVNLDGLGIVYTKQPPSYASSTSPKPTTAPRWRDNSKRPHYAHHRRISTAAIIALAQKQSFTPQKVIAIFSIVASATYLARALPPLWPSEPSSVYNPRVVYHPAEIYEAMRPVEPKRSKKTRKANTQQQKQPVVVPGSGNAQSVQEAKAQAKAGDFFDQVEPKFWKEMSKQNGLDAKVLQKGQEVDYALVDDLASEDVEALILDEEEDAFYDASAFSTEESEIWEDAVHLDPNAKAVEKNSLPLPLRGSHRAPNAQKDQSIAGLAYLANRKEAAKVIKREKKAEVATKTEVIEPQHTAKSTIFEDEGEVMGDILMKKR